MLNLKNFVKKVHQPQNEKGQGLVEYALILVLVAIVVIAVLLVLGPVVGNVFSEVTCSLQGASCASGGESAQLTVTSTDTVLTPDGNYRVVSVSFTGPSGVTYSVDSSAPVWSPNCTSSNCQYTTSANASYNSGTGIISGSDGQSASFTW